MDDKAQETGVPMLVASAALVPADRERFRGAMAAVIAAAGHVAAREPS